MWAIDCVCTCMTSTRAQLLPLQGGATPRVGGGGTPRSSLQSPTATPRRSPSPLHPEDPQRQQKSTLLLERMGVGRVCTTSAGTDEAPPPTACRACLPFWRVFLVMPAASRSSHPVLRVRAGPPRSLRLESRSQISSQPSAAAAAAAGVPRRPRPRRRRSACVPCRCEPPALPTHTSRLTPCY